MILLDLYEQLKETNNNNYNESAAGRVDKHGRFDLRSLADEIGTACVNDEPSPQHKPAPPAICQKAMEALSWLESHGYIAPYFEHQTNQHRLTQKCFDTIKALPAMPLPNTEDMPREMLHENLRGSAWHDFVRQDFSGAVFKAFREVEIAIRVKGEYSKEKIGVSLVRDAFKVGIGPLSAQSEPDAEQQAMMSLFAGSLGLFKNPNSHRAVEFSDPKTAMRAFQLADLLLRILDQIDSSEATH